jgi:hypothetical protein
MRIISNIEACTANRIADSVLVRGWAYAPDAPIQSFHAQLNDGPRVRCEYGLRRQDVAMAHRLPASLSACGFLGVLPLHGLRGYLRVTLSATLADGRQVEVSQQEVQDPWHQAPRPIEWQHLIKFPEERPVFIVGMSRSGTSAITSALLLGAKLPGYPEGHLFNVMQQLVEGMWGTWEDVVRKLGPDRSPTNAIGNYNIFTAINQVITTFHNVYHEGVSSSNWVDKTTDTKGIRAVPLLSHIYPQGKFILMHRHPIKVVLSRLKKFPDLQPRQSFVEWNQCLHYWMQAKGELQAHSFAEVAQRDLACRPQQVAALLRRFLSLSPEQEEGICTTLKTERPQFTGSSSDLEEVYLEDCNWREEDKTLFLALCEQGARELGYPVLRSSAPS